MDSVAARRKRTEDRRLRLEAELLDQDRKAADRQRELEARRAVLHNKQREHDLAITAAKALLDRDRDRDHSARLDLLKKRDEELEHKRAHRASQAASLVHTPDRSPSADFSPITTGHLADQAAFKLARIQIMNHGASAFEPSRPSPSPESPTRFDSPDSLFSSMPVSRDGWSASLAAKQDLAAFQAERKARRDARIKATDDRRARDAERLHKFVQDSHFQPDPANLVELERQSSGTSSLERRLSLMFNKVSDPNRTSATLRSPGITHDSRSSVTAPTATLPTRSRAATLQGPSPPAAATVAVASALTCPSSPFAPHVSDLVVKYKETTVPPAKVNPHLSGSTPKSAPLSPRISSIMGNLLKAPDTSASKIKHETVQAAATHVDDIKAKFEGKANTATSPGLVSDFVDRKPSIPPNSIAASNAILQLLPVALVPAEPSTQVSEARLSRGFETRLSVVTVPAADSIIEIEDNENNKTSEPLVDSAIADLALAASQKAPADDAVLDVKPLEGTQPVVDIKPAEKQALAISQISVEEAQGAPVAAATFNQSAVVIAFAKATYEFEASTDGNEMSFAVGDLFEIFEEDDGWCKARKYGTEQYGFIPASYTSPIAFKEIQHLITKATSQPAETLSAQIQQCAVQNKDISSTAGTLVPNFAPEAFAMDTAIEQVVDAQTQPRCASGSRTTGPPRRPPSQAWLEARAQDAHANAFNQFSKVSSASDTPMTTRSKPLVTSSPAEAAELRDQGASIDRHRTITSSTTTSARAGKTASPGKSKILYAAETAEVDSTLVVRTILKSAASQEEMSKARPSSLESSIFSVMRKHHLMADIAEASGSSSLVQLHSPGNSPISMPGNLSFNIANSISQLNAHSKQVSSAPVPSFGKYGKAVPRREPTLLKVKGKRKVYAVRVPKSVESMNQGDVFLLEVPRTDSGSIFAPDMQGDPTKASLYVWYGADASVVKKAKGKEVVYRTQDREWGGKNGVISELDQGVENDDAAEFWKIITGSPSTPSAIQSAAEGGDDLEFEKQLEAKTFLYGVNSDNTDTANPNFQVLVNGKNLTTKNVHGGSSFVVDCFDEIFVWHGRQSPEVERHAAEAFAEQLSKQAGRPSNVIIDIERDPAERVLFKERFMDWTDGFNIEVKQQTNIGAKDRSRFVYDRGGWDTKKVEKVDVIAMYEPPPPPSRWGISEDPDIGGPLKPEEDLGWVSLDVLLLEEKGTSKPVDKIDAQILYSGESYTFVYKHMTGRPDSPKETSVLYYWIGAETKSSDQANAAYTAADIAKKGCARQVRILQGKEPSHFLKMLGGFVLVRKGLRQTFNPHDKALYHIRAVARDINQIFVWNGVGAFENEKMVANTVAHRISDARPIQEIQEGAEPKLFWEKLAPNAKKGVSEYACAEYFAMRCKWPDSYRTRLFRISFGLKNGNPTAEEVEYYTQNDLDGTAVYILDAFFELYVWIGSEAIQKFKDVRLALETCMEYVSYVSKKQPQRKIDGTKCYCVRSGNEPACFKACFTAFDDGAEDYSESPGFLKRFQRSGKGKNEGLKVQMVPEILARLRTAVYSLEELKSKNALPIGVDPNRIEDFMSPEDFQRAFKMDKTAFAALPQWKQTDLKKKAGLF
ncbi:hypothetical protein SeMB42_g06380 [Synchytrium endobioticum]|uniref:HP domain-containing protein n=1 Tax=Synchytrium endobioticum TaxID=286115 RepID=A0A507CLA0_9FUNG|nr:hypothetical protein SeMB42_g06380 [Synchytrium endobioticum]